MLPRRKFVFTPTVNCSYQLALLIDCRAKILLYMLSDACFQSHDLVMTRSRLLLDLHIVLHSTFIPGYSVSMRIQKNRSTTLHDSFNMIVSRTIRDSRLNSDVSNSVKLKASFRLLRWRSCFRQNQTTVYLRRGKVKSLSHSVLQDTLGTGVWRRSSSLKLLVGSILGI